MIVAEDVCLDLSPGRQKRSECQILHNLTFDFKPGDRVGVFGENGAGKSTYLRLLAGIYMPTSGLMVRQGDVNTLLDVGAGMNSEATGMENIYIRGIILGLSRSYIKSRVDEIVCESGLASDIYKPLRHYSSGMLIRLAFSISLIKEADILLMDEWLSVGDEGFNARASERLKKYIDNSSILVLASHSTQLLKNSCNRFFRMQSGRLAEIKIGEF